MLTELETRCAHCKGGLVCPDEWQAWYARADEIEAAFAAEHGSIDGIESSADWQELVDERPGCEEETECVACAGTGVVLTDTGRAVLDWARQHLAA